MTRDHAESLELFKVRRRHYVDQLEYDDDFDTAAKLADIQLVITAIEAVIAEPVPVKTGPRIAYGADGYPK